MAKYNEEVKVFANLIKDKNMLKAQIAGGTDVIQIGKRNIESLKIEGFQLEVKTADVSSYTFWGNETWTSDDSVLWEATVGHNFETSQRLKWLWEKKSELELGTYDANIDVANGDIRLED